LFLSSLIDDIATFMLLSKSSYTEIDSNASYGNYIG